VIEDGDEKGACYRSTFIIDKKGILRHASINDLDANIDVHEVFRLVKGF
jgi:alkyl hydroperoxide reductase subunit AhpC